ncbi:MAG: winged helix-turn-helix transcriptional regulator [Candidatus Sabulitectum sp.]|nr:winged helix-turn-helix transcriptional regulator [Candidatus Sabulitectum sp.]
MESVEMVKVFRALSCKKRMAIVELLLQQELCVGTLAAKLGASQSSVSQHLRVLRDSGLVTDSRYGYHIHYTANREILGQMIGGLSGMMNTMSTGAECPRKGTLCVEDTKVQKAKTG